MAKRKNKAKYAGKGRGKAGSSFDQCANDDELDTPQLDRLPMGELTPQGALIPSYDWVKGPAVAALPPGLEVRMDLDGGVGMKCARIPSEWRLKIDAEGQCDTYRQDVGRRTR